MAADPPQRGGTPQFLQQVVSRPYPLQSLSLPEVDRRVVVGDVAQATEFFKVFGQVFQPHGLEFLAGPAVDVRTAVTNVQQVSGDEKGRIVRAGHRTSVAGLV
ncbi:hypothetical protein CDN98_23570 [Roseateles terrae]|nr:hypothetical protein CDN98_23570 [Roseateles terrae]